MTHVLDPHHLRCRPLPGALLFSLLLTLGAGADALHAQEDDEGPPTIEAHTEGMERIDGFLPLYWDASEGTLWMEVGRWDEELLHYTSLPAGLGQNDIGLNRGDLSSEHVVVFRRVGPRVLMEEPNYGYRAVGAGEMERRSVDDGFPTSIHWGFQVEAETGDRVLVDATDFLLRDWTGVVRTLDRTGQGSYELDEDRSALFLPRTLGFPQNTEIEVTLTFATDDPGNLVESVTPTGEAVTIRQHHSFVELPPMGEFEMRRHDPRAGYGSMSYMDFSQPIDEDLTQRFIARHRLEKQDPSAEMSPPVEPIVYYLDPGTPEPVRSALLEGGRWWNQAFEAAGYIDAFQVEVLPDDADPMDARYNVIQWVHRSTRGWSYGNSIRDPRTGEILKGHVTLGSLRVRQDYLLGEGLVAPYLDGDEDPEDIPEMALQRIRQLSAHEIGHTIGLSHNYIASAQVGEGVMSVMDYPHPRVELDGGEVSLGRASYPDEIGAWDKIAVRYGYTDFPEGTDEDAALEAILQEGMEMGITFITDQDARPSGSAHPQVHLWDNGADVSAELDRMMEVRRVALDRFGERAIRQGEPMATMEEALVPLFLHHRYQVEATTKIVGGQYYTYAMRGDGQEPPRAVPREEQEEALESVLRTIHPQELTLPREVLATLPPRPPGYSPHQELFQRHTGLVFDAVAPAAAASDATLSLLLHPQRAARLVQQSALEPDLPSLAEVLEAARDGTFGVEPADAYEAEVGRAVERTLVEQLMMLAHRAPMPQVRAVTQAELDDLAVWLSRESDGAEAGDRAHYRMLIGEIGRFSERDWEPGDAPETPDMPPGSPIGSPSGVEAHWLGSSWSPADLPQTGAAALSCPWR